MSARRCENMRGKGEFKVDVAAFTEAVKRDGRPVRRLMNDIGVDQAVYYRIRERGSCLLGTADRLCESLGIDLWQIEASR